MLVFAVDSSVSIIDFSSILASFVLQVQKMKMKIWKIEAMASIIMKFRDFQKKMKNHMIVQETNELNSALLLLWYVDIWTLYYILALKQILNRIKKYLL